jgi:hypothetical protein
VVVAAVKDDVTVPFAMGVTEAGERAQVTVALIGATEQERPTAELNPLSEVTVILEVPPFPAITVAVAGDELKPKSSTVRV